VLRGRRAVPASVDRPVVAGFELLAHVGSWSFIWRDLILDLADDFRVAAFDAPGTASANRRVESAVMGLFADRPLLTIFGRGASSTCTSNHGGVRCSRRPSSGCSPRGVGNHFPMGDDPHQLAAWIRDWHGTAVAGGMPRRGAAG
jgi:hypothetical protein